MHSNAYVLFLNGGYGVGKSAVLEHVGDLLAAAGQPFSLMDVDWFHRSWPSGDDDPDNVQTAAINMAAVWTNYRRVGPRQLVVSGVLATAADRHRYTEALALPVRSVRLEAGPAVTETRLRGRCPDARPDALQWHLERYETLAAQLAKADLDEYVIATDNLTPAAVARRVTEHFGLPAAPSGPQSGSATRSTG
ncbi:hypothetical protein ACFTTN_27495 [Streptomyces niveus]|uniref:hypothetical protein n=1 Tax=Streptomyces niveus TaxID=193462 RepID=UPI00362F3D9E